MKLFLIILFVFSYSPLHAGVDHLLPKPQQVQAAGKDFPIGKIRLSTPVMEEQWKNFIIETGGELSDIATHQITYIDPTTASI